MEEYNNALSYWILLSNTNILAKIFKHRDQIKRGMAAIKIYHQQHNQKKWFHTAQIIEAAHPLTEVMKEGSFQEQAWHHRQTTVNQSIVWKMESVNMLMFSWDNTLFEASKYASSSAFHFKPAVTPEWDVSSLLTFLSTLVLKRFVFSQFHIPHLTKLFYALKLGHLLTINFPLCSSPGKGKFLTVPLLSPLLSWTKVLSPPHLSRIWVCTFCGTIQYHLTTSSPYSFQPRRWRQHVSTKDSHPPITLNSATA